MNYIRQRCKFISISFSSVLIYINIISFAHHSKTKIFLFIQDKNATRNCTENGTWFVNEITNVPWADYTACADKKIVTVYVDLNSTEMSQDDMVSNTTRNNHLERKIVIIFAEFNACHQSNIPNRICSLPAIINNSIFNYVIDKVS